MLSTHILSEAQQICDRVIIINKGRIVAEDAPENLQTRLSSVRTVFVRVKDSTEEAASLIRDIPGVVAVKVSEDGQIQFENVLDQDARPLVAKKLVNKGFDLLELAPEAVNLEEIFLKLTREATEGESQADPFTNEQKGNEA